MRFVHASGVAVAALVASLSLRGLALADEVSNVIPLTIDEASIVKVTRNFETIVVGNATVARVELINPTTLLFTGKRFGTTNILFLNEQGDVVDEKRIAVGQQSSNQVTMIRGDAGAKGFVTRMYDCTQKCVEEPVPGTQNFADLQGQYASWVDYNSAQAVAGVNADTAAVKPVSGPTGALTNTFSGMQPNH